MDLFEHQFYKFNYRLLNFVGLWPFQKSRMGRVYIMNIAFLSFNLTQVLKMFTSKGNFSTILEVAPIWITMMNVAIKYHTFHRGIINMRILVNNIIIDWQTWKTEEEVEIMKKYAEKGRLYSLAYGIYIYFTILLFIISPFGPYVLDVIIPRNESRPLKLPVLAEYFLDPEEHFFLIYAHMVTTTLIALTAVVATDTQLMIFASHVCSVFAVVGFRLENFLKDAYAINNWTEHQRKKYIENLVLSINGHKKAIEFVNRIESAFSLSLLLQSGFNIICMTASLYQLSVATEQKSVEALRSIIFVVGQLFHIFYTCYSGQRIINHSSEIGWKAYSAMWYDAPREINKLLLLVIRRSHEPSYLTAGKIYVFCYESFSTIVQTSTSYFMVLSSVH